MNAPRRNGSLIDLQSATHSRATMAPPPALDAAGCSRKRLTTLVSAREVLALTRSGLSKKDIARGKNITEERVRQLLELGRSELSGEPVSTQQRDNTALSPLPPQDSRMTQCTVVYRAVLALRSDRRLLSCTPAEKLFWLDVVQEINAFGQGGLRFGRRGDGFKSRSAFAVASGGSEADLEVLINRGLLVDFDGGIDLPNSLGLKPRQKIGLSPQRSLGRVAAVTTPLPIENTSVQGQTSMLLGIAGGAAEGTTDLSGPIIQPNNLAARVQDLETSRNLPSENLIPTQIPAGDSKSRAASSTTTTTTTLNNENAKSSGSSGRASEPPLPGREDLGRGKDLENLGNVALSQEPVSFAVELARAAGLSRPPTPAEVSLVSKWLKEGTSAETLHEIVRLVKMRENCPPEPALMYFDGAVKDGRKAATRPPPQAGAAVKSAAPAEAPELARLQSLWEKYDNRRTGSIPPTRRNFLAALRDNRAAALTWLKAIENHHTHGQTGDPPLAFDAWIKAHQTNEVDAIVEVAQGTA